MPQLTSRTFALGRLLSIATLLLVISCAAQSRHSEPATTTPAEPPKAAIAPCLTAAACETACAQGDANSCRRMARLLGWAFKTPSDGERQLDFFERACTLGDGRACAVLGDRFVFYFPDWAIERFERGCAHGAPGACSSLAYHLEDNRPNDSAAAARVAKARARAIQLCSSKIPDKYVGSCAALRETRHEDRRALIARHASLLKRRCDAGLSGACFTLASHHRGNGDLVGAVQLQRRACDLGNRFACYLGIEKATDRHLMWCNRRRPPTPAAVNHLAAMDQLCTEGLSNACTAAARLVLSCRLGGKSTPDARIGALYRRACTLGVGSACTWLILGHYAPADQHTHLGKRACMLGGGCTFVPKTVKATLKPWPSRQR